MAAITYDLVHLFGVPLYPFSASDKGYKLIVEHFDMETGVVIVIYEQVAGLHGCFGVVILPPCVVVLQLYNEVPIPVAISGQKQLTR